MTAFEFLAYLRRLEIKVWAEGEQLRVRGPKEALTPAVRADLAHHKAELLMLLQQARVSSQPAAARQPFELARGPLMRARLFRLDTTEHVLFTVMHHIISDGWSNTVFANEMLALYPALAAGRPSPLPPLPVQYADYAIWQRQWL